jgi:lysozyme
MNHADASHEEHGKLVDDADFGAAYEAGYRGVVHKATEGEHYADPLYASRRAKAIAAGLLWGAYHFMRPGDPGNQVSAFVRAVSSTKEPGPSTYVAPPAWSGDILPNFVRISLDFEDNKLGLWQAEHWLDVVHMSTQQYPWLYSGFLVRELLQKRGTGAELEHYPLWLAEYSTVARVPRMWKNYVLWQRSGDGVGPGVHDIPGIGRKQDVDYFDGTDLELRAAWYGVPPQTEA